MLPKTTQPSGTDRISTPDGCLVSFKAVYLTGVTPIEEWAESFQSIKQVISSH